MDPGTLITFIVTAKEAADALINAARGAKHKKSVWYELCMELADNCDTIVPLLDSISEEIVQGQYTEKITKQIEPAIVSLTHAVQQGVELIDECQDAFRAVLFVRGQHYREKFDKVAKLIARCLRTIPLAVVRANLAIEQDVARICQQLEHAKFELSERDRELLENVHEAVNNSADVQRDAMVSLFGQLERHLDVKMRDMKQEIRANMGGDNAIDLDAKEQKFMSQIATLLAMTAGA